MAAPVQTEEEEDDAEWCERGKELLFRMLSVEEKEEFVSCRSALCSACCIRRQSLLSAEERRGASRHPLFLLVTHGAEEKTLGGRKDLYNSLEKVISGEQEVTEKGRRGKGVGCVGELRNREENDEAKHEQEGIYD